MIKRDDFMRNITTRNFRILCDFPAIRQFMVDIYEKDWRNGVASPFFEYALSSSWMDKSFVHRNHIWEDNGKIVAFVFNESPVKNSYFSLRPGYEDLIDEMISYVEENMPRIDGKQALVLYDQQKALINGAISRGYKKVYEYTEALYDFRAPLEYPLPEGYHFVEFDKMDVAKVQECCWKGFNHEAEEGPWNGDIEGGLSTMAAPNATPEYQVAIEDQKGEYVCFAGMWWTPENHLAYMEPLCTVPEHRGRGLARAALSELYHRMKPLGATHMTGGDNPFYLDIGYKPAFTCTYWEKSEK